MGIPYLLLADDDADDRRFLVDAFHRQNPGYQIEQVDGGFAVLEYLKNARDLPVILLLDFEMPDLNGEEVLRELAANNKFAHIVKIIWSNAKPPLHIHDHKRLGADYFWQKPANNDELHSIVSMIRAIFDLAAMEMG
jgi:CheY-like chemotaxis protein